MPDPLLTWHFVRRFLDNDLLSPDADSHETMSSVAAVLIAGSLFTSTMMGGHYLSMIAQSPARTAVPSIDNRVFIFGCAMGVMALAALAGWNALSLDSRDVAILGPLPIPRRAVVRAKLSAVAIVAGALGGALTALTSIIFPLLMVGKLPVGLLQTGEIVLAQAGVTLAAGFFGFLSILAIREVLHAVAGPRLFARVSVPVHACLTIAVIASFLLIPALSRNVAGAWFADRSAPSWLVPPLWFAGLYEYLVGGIIIGLPHGPLPKFLVAPEQQFADIYTLSRPAFAGLAAIAVVALGTVASLGLPAYWWNNRRFDGAPPAALAGRRSRAGRIGAWMLNRVIVRHPAAQAGFWFAWKAIARSLPHRMSMATAAAIGVAAIVVGLPLAFRNTQTNPLPLALFAPELIALGAIVVGFHHAIGLPADLRANWLFHVTWLGETRRYLSGVRRLGLVGLILPVAALLIPVHAVVMGVRLAAAKALLASLVAAVFLQALLAGCHRLPFAVQHLPSSTLKTRGPVYLFAAIAAVSAVSALERAALATGTGMLGFVGGAVALYATLGWIGRQQPCGLDVPDVDPAAAERTLQLGLNG